MVGFSTAPAPGIFELFDHCGASIVLVAARSKLSTPPLRVRLSLTRVNDTLVVLRGGVNM